VTAFARPLTDPDRSLTRQLDVSTLPTSVRVAVGLGFAAVFLWPIVLLFPDALTIEAWSGEVFSAAWFSIWQTVLATTVGVALSIPLSWASAELSIPGRTLLRGLWTLPIVTPAFAVALGASWIWDGGSPLLILAHAGLGLAIGVRLGSGAWSMLDPHEAQTARTLGFGEIQLVRRLYLPALGRTFVAAWALAAGLAVSTFGAAYLLAPDPTATLPLVAGPPGRGAAPSAAGASLVLILLAAAAFVAFLRCRPAGDSSTIHSPHVSLELLSVPRLVVLALATLFGLVLAIGPLFALLHGALTIGAAEQITNANLAALADAARPLEVDSLEAVRRSALLLVVAVGVSLPVGFVAAVVIAPLRGWAATLIEGALLLPLALPVVLAAGLRAGGLDSPSWLLFIHFAIVFPLVVRVVLPGVRARVRTSIEAATVLGASRWTSWRRLVAPTLGAHLVLAAVLAMAWSVGELGAALLLHRVDSAPVSTAVVFALRDQTVSGDGRAFALATAIVLFVTILFVTIEHRRPREITEF